MYAATNARGRAILFPLNTELLINNTQVVPAMVNYVMRTRLMDVRNRPSTCRCVCVNSNALTITCVFVISAANVREGERGGERERMR